MGDAALIALASVGAVVWTGGLIVLQLKRSVPTYTYAQHHLINAGMACAAYGFLAPLLGLLAANPAITRNIAIAAAVLYACLTLSNISSIVRGLVLGNNDAVFIGLGYLSPTVALVILVILPFPNTIAWSSGVLIFAAYFGLSYFSRGFP
jgi:hypothetical protein